MKNPRAGLTLIEVLIAVSLLSLLSIGMLWSMRVGLGAMGKTNERLNANRLITGAQKVLGQQVAGLMPVTAQSVGTIGNGQPGTVVQFFQGESRNMRFVSSYSLQEGSRGTPQILEYTVIPGENGVGVRLIVNEWPYTGPLSTGAFVIGRSLDQDLHVSITHFVPIGVGPHAFVIADRLASCQFLYKEPRPGVELERWSPLWSVENRWPLAIRFEMEPLNPDDGRLRVGTLTALVHVNRPVNERIADGN